MDILSTSGKHQSREQSDECTPEIRIATADLADRVSRLLDCLGFNPAVKSGFRTKASNKAAGGSKNSAHCEGKAVDLADSDGSLKRAILHDAGLLGRFDLYMEHADATPTWCHLQSRPTKSGNRVFRP